MLHQQGKKSKYGDLLYYITKINPVYIIVCDIETTGLYPSSDQIVEIGIVKLDLTSGRMEKIFDRIVRDSRFDEKHANAWIFSNSSLQFDEVLNASELTIYLGELQEIFKKYPATAYNKQFDFGFLRSRGISIGKEEACPMIQATNIIKLPPKYNKPGYKYPSVEEAWRFYFPNKQYREAHRAYDDAEHEAQIIYTMYQKGHWIISQEEN